MACPACMALLFDGATFCPSCGAVRSRSETAPSPTTITCPACRSAMQWIRLGDVDLLECGQCDGTWIEATAFDRLCTQREQQAAILEGPPPSRKAPSRSATERVRYRPCLQCGKMMNRLNFGRLSGTIVDLCSGHGVFLDRGELHQIVRFILDGGLGRTRAAELARLKEEEQRLRELLTQLSRART